MQAILIENQIIQKNICSRSARRGIKYDSSANRLHLVDQQFE